MIDRRRHRGPHPADREIFDEANVPRLRSAVSDLSWLLTRGYSRRAAITLVGNRFELVERQRTAVSRSACSDQALRARSSRRVGPEAIEELSIDGFNLITTVEAALAGGVLLLGRDGALRDMASLHGTYREVEETLPALIAIGEWLEPYGIEHCRWLLDRPVSNSGRLRGAIEELAEARGWPWRCELVADPDPVLMSATGWIATADSAILDGSEAPWIDLSRRVVASLPADRAVWLLDLGRT